MLTVKNEGNRSEKLELSIFRNTHSEISVSRQIAQNPKFHRRNGISGFASMQVKTMIREIRSYLFNFMEFYGFSKMYL